ncbi:MAG TPA: glycosyltransferase family 39 protein [Pedococcus sp.]
MDTTTAPPPAAPSRSTGSSPQEVSPGTDAPGPGAPAHPTRLPRVWRGPQSDPRWARPALLALLLATAAFYLVGLTESGWANSFYSAAVQAGSQSWEAFLYGSSDAGNSITVDKPPASLWVMALSVRLLGLSSFAILLPEVLMGVATVGVVHATVKRHFGAGAGLLAGVVMALTPVAVLMFRFNNPDALLVLLMALAAWATLRAVEHGSVRWFALAGALLGLGFLTKALQVFLVVPALGLAWLLLADTTLRRRVVGAAAGLGAMVLSAGWWVALVELVPASMRPYIGGSQDNSFLSVTFGYNGLGRLSGEETGSVGGGNGWGETGLGRMFSDAVGGQISWLIPSALVLLAVGVWLRRRAPRTDGRRAAYVVWGGWLLVTMVTFSLMAGLFHEYYTVALAPAVAAVVGMGAQEAWEHRDHRVGSVTLAVATTAAAGWSFVLLSRADWVPWLRVAVLALGAAAALLLLAVTHLESRWVPAVVASALVAALAGPAAWSAATVATPHTGSIVTAGPAVAGGRGFGGGPGGGARLQPPGGQGLGGQAPGGQAFGGQAPGGTGGTGGTGGGLGGLLDASTPSTEVVAALSADADAYTWVAAAIGSQNAAGLQLATGLPVMAIGGFNGSDPSPTLEQFQALVAAGEVHYFAAGGGGRGGGLGGGSTISTWVQQSFATVTLGGSTFYDLTQPLTSTTSTGTTTQQS